VTRNKLDILSKSFKFVVESASTLHVYHLNRLPLTYEHLSKRAYKWSRKKWVSISYIWI